MNRTRATKSDAELRTGMGLYLGTVIAGNIGSSERMEYTIIGDALNTAARLESITRELNTDILISHTIRSSLGNKFPFQSKSKVLLRDKTEATEVFTLGDPFRERIFA